MKMDSYRQRDFNIRKRRQMHPLVSVLSGALLVTFSLAAFHTFFPDVSQRLLRGVAAPIWEGERSVASSLAVHWKALSEKAELVTYTLALEERLREKRSIELQNRFLEAENQTLRELLNARVIDATVLAPVLRRPPATPYDTLLVDLPEGDGVAVGNRVLADHSVVIGELAGISGRVGSVSLYSSSGRETEVLIGTSTQSVIARGLGSGNFVAEVPREFAVAEGDRITLPGLSSFAFSTVSSVLREASDAFILVQFQSPVSLRELSWVEVITDDVELREVELFLNVAEPAATSSEEAL
jgi:cell shape-determining protein MreC